MRKFALVALSCIAASAASAGDCKLSKNHTAAVESGQTRRVVVSAGAGDLIIRGEANRAGVEASGRACASSQKLLDQITIEAHREGDTVYVKSVLPSAVLDGIRYAQLDLRVFVPEGALLTVEDSSGDLQLSNVQAASVSDSSGDQDIRNIGGNLEVVDSSGDVRIEGVRGALKIRDNSGDLIADDVKGDAEVSLDSAGDIVFKRIGGGVRILSDSSGDITISDVQRDVTIDEDSSGAIRVEGVGGNFSVGSDGSGGICWQRVAGQVQIPKQ
ncbi:MAG TPA: DUF4097 family beta strand repeat-containing protein [Steroidobacter sp.]|nr:DUF4097 family beta strand repeat-containing protein [Steroidobacter sp.]